jgi:hypothetical protein
MYVMYYVSMIRCWQLVWILVRTNEGLGKAIREE